MMRIFGRDIFLSPGIIGHIRGLTGLDSIKPFECVGTQDESVLAVYLAVETYMSRDKEVPEGLLKIKSDIGRTHEEVVQLKNKVLNQWGGTYNLPPEHLTILRSAWQKLEDT